MKSGISGDLGGVLLEQKRINGIICRIENLANDQPGLVEILDKIAGAVEDVQSAVSSERLVDISLEYKDYASNTKTSYSRRLKSGEINGEGYNE